MTLQQFIIIFGCIQLVLSQVRRWLDQGPHTGPHMDSTKLVPAS
jgi:hypothetical protein